MDYVSIRGGGTVAPGDSVSGKPDGSTFGIPGGQFQYVSQLGNASGEWTYDAQHDYGMYTNIGKSPNGKYDMATGCNIAAFTMALGSLGIDVNPGEVCYNNEEILKEHAWAVGPNDWHPTYMGFPGELAGKFGVSHASGKIDELLKQYESNPGTYSAPVVKIPSSGTDGTHFVVVTGYLGGGRYAVVDPYNQTRSEISSGQIESAYQLYK